MSDSEFERPGVGPRPTPEDWPYHVPTPEDPPPERFPQDVRQLPTAAEEPRPRRVRLVAAVTVGVLVGALAGGVWVAVTLLPSPEPQPLPITVDTFPRELLGKERNDITLREAGFGPTVERLDAEFADQLAAFRFAYGGDGATLGYGRRLQLTIVNGTLPPPLPREVKFNRDGWVTQTRRLISLRTDDVVCTFEPSPVLNLRTGIEEPGDLASDGLTECVLNDAERNLGLRLSEHHVERGADAFETSATFRDELERLHARLIA